MRLIDSDVLIKQCKPRGIADEVWKESNDYKQIINAPTIDAEPVVRCRDCKRYEALKYTDDYTGNVSHKYVCQLCKRQMLPTDYCSYGERREDCEA